MILLCTFVYRAHYIFLVHESIYLRKKPVIFLFLKVLDSFLDIHWIDMCLTIFYLTGLNILSIKKKRKKNEKRFKAVHSTNILHLLLCLHIFCVCHLMQVHIGSHVYCMFIIIEMWYCVTTLYLCPTPAMICKSKNIQTVDNFIFFVLWSNKNTVNWLNAIINILIFG